MIRTVNINKDWKLNTAVIIRNATPQDMLAVAEIYLHEVLHGIATFEEIPPSVDEMLSRRESILNAQLPYLVAVIDDDVVGYSYANAYHRRPAFRYAIENSVYVANGEHGKGIGGKLLTQLIARCEQGPWRQMIAVIGHSGNAASIALHQRHGFQHIGSLKAVGYKFNQWIDTVLMQRALSTGSGSAPD